MTPCDGDGRGVCERPVMNSITASALASGHRTPRVPAVPVVDVVVPVYNEEHMLAASITRLCDYLDARFPFRWRVTIADNASTDGTSAIAKALAQAIDGVTAVHLEEKGRGRALRQVWSTSDADVVAYMDVDLSTDLDVAVAARRRARLRSHRRGDRFASCSRARTLCAARAAS